MRYIKTERKVAVLLKRRSQTLSDYDDPCSNVCKRNSCKVPVICTIHTNASNDSESRIKAEEKMMTNE